MRGIAMFCASHRSQATPYMTDIRRLVSRIADAMGPQASSEKVEAVVAIALEEIRPESSGVPSHEPDRGSRAIVTAYGIDHHGILTTITSELSAAGCNILDVSQKILQTYFTLIMLIDVGRMESSIEALQKRLSDAGERLNVRIMVQHEDLFNAMHRP
jgi:ACT domain-containing protein